MTDNISNVPLFQEEQEEDVCRVCRLEEEEDNPMVHPCKCSGSVRFVHPDCLKNWLASSQKKACEICGHKYTFTKVYPDHIPDTIPPIVYLRQIVRRVVSAALYFHRCWMVVITWLIILPMANMGGLRTFKWFADYAIAGFVPADAADKLINATSFGNATLQEVIRNATSVVIANQTSPINNTVTPIERGLTARVFRFALSALRSSPPASIPPNITIPTPPTAPKYRSLILRSTFDVPSPFHIFQGQILSISLAAMIVALIFLREWYASYDWSKHNDKSPGIIVDDDIKLEEWVVRKGVTERRFVRSENGELKPAKGDSRAVKKNSEDKGSDSEESDGSVTDEWTDDEEVKDAATRGSTSASGAAGPTLGNQPNSGVPLPPLAEFVAVARTILGDRAPNSKAQTNEEVLEDLKGAHLITQRAIELHRLRLRLSEGRSAGPMWKAPELLDRKQDGEDGSTTLALPDEASTSAAKEPGPEDDVAASTEAQAIEENGNEQLEGGRDHVSTASISPEEEIIPTVTSNLAAPESATIHNDDTNPELPSTAEQADTTPSEAQNADLVATTETAPTTLFTTGPAVATNSASHPSATHPSSSSSQPVPNQGILGAIGLVPSQAASEPGKTYQLPVGIGRALFHFASELVELDIARHLLAEGMRDFPTFLEHHAVAEDTEEQAATRARDVRAKLIQQNEAVRLQMENTLHRFAGVLKFSRTCVVYEAEIRELLAQAAKAAAEGVQQEAGGKSGQVKGKQAGSAVAVEAEESVKSDGAPPSSVSAEADPIAQPVVSEDEGPNIDSEATQAFMASTEQPAINSAAIPASTTEQTSMPREEHNLDTKHESLPPLFASRASMPWETTGTDLETADAGPSQPGTSQPISDIPLIPSTSLLTTDEDKSDGTYGHASAKDLPVTAGKLDGSIITGLAIAPGPPAVEAPAVPNAAEHPAIAEDGERANGVAAPANEDQLDEWDDIEDEEADWAENPVDQLADQAELPENGDLVNFEEEDIEGGWAGDDWDQILEVIGLHGPISALIQNLILAIAVMGAAMVSFVLFPMTAGKVMLCIDPIRSVIATGKMTWQGSRTLLRWFRFISDPVIDFGLEIARDVVFRPVIGAFFAAEGIVARKFGFGPNLSSSPWSNVSGRLLQAFTFAKKAGGSTQAAPRLYNFAVPPILSSRVNFIPSSITIDLTPDPALVFDAFEKLGNASFNAYEKYRAFSIQVATGKGLGNGLTCLAVGYFIAIAGMTCLAWEGERGNIRMSEDLKQGLRRYRLSVKLVMFLALELVAFPLGAGALIVLCTIPIFPHVSIMGRLAEMRETAVGMLFVTWMVGTMFMYGFAQVLSWCRSFCRPGALYFVRDPHDPSYSPVKEIINRSTRAQFHKLGVSTVMYSFVIWGLFGAIPWGLQTLGPAGIFPLRLEKYGPLTPIPFDYLFLLIAIPPTLKRIRPQHTIKKILLIYWRVFEKLLRLQSLLLHSALPAKITTTGIPSLGRAETNFFRVIDIPFQSMFGKYDPTATLARVPAQDRVLLLSTKKNGIPRREGMFIPLTLKMQPKTPEDKLKMIRQDLLARRADPQRDPAKDFKVVSLPPYWRTRIHVFILSLLAGGGLSLSLFVLCPIILGREMLKASFGQIHDGYSFLVGAYTIYAALTAGTRTYRIIRSFGRAKQRRLAGRQARVKRFILVSLRKIVAVAAVFVIHPILKGMIWEIRVGLLVRYGVGQAVPVIHLWDAWALGAVLNSIELGACGLFVHDRGQNAHQMHHLWRNPLNRDLQRLISVLLPEFRSMLINLAVPFLLTFCQLALQSRNVHFLKIQFRVAGLISWALIAIAIRLPTARARWSSWRQKVIDAEYVVEERVENYEPEPESKLHKTSGETEEERYEDSDGGVAMMGDADGEQALGEILGGITGQETPILMESNPEIGAKEVGSHSGIQGALTRLESRGDEEIEEDRSPGVGKEAVDALRVDTVLTDENIAADDAEGQNVEEVIAEARRMDTL